MTSRQIAAGAMLSLAMLTACGRDDPVAPSLHTVSGQVVLVGYLLRADGGFAGTRVVADADNVPVELVYGSRVVARALTTSGTYLFKDVPPGAYRARTAIVGDLRDSTAVLTVIGADLVSRDLLELRSQGDLRPTPNPAVPNTDIYFMLPDTQFVEMRILDMEGRRVRHVFAGERPAGLNHLWWYGTDDANLPAPDELYWATLSTPNQIRVQLLFR